MFLSLTPSFKKSLIQTLGALAWVVTWTIPIALIQSLSWAFLVYFFVKKTIKSWPQSWSLIWFSLKMEWFFFKIDNTLKEIMSILFLFFCSFAFTSLALLFGGMSLGFLALIFQTPPFAPQTIVSLSWVWLFGLVLNVGALALKTPEKNLLKALKKSKSRFAEYQDFQNVRLKTELELAIAKKKVSLNHQLPKASTEPKLKPRL